MAILIMTAAFAVVAGWIIADAVGEPVGRWFIGRIVQWLPEQERDHSREEWLAHLDEINSGCGKLRHALSCARGFPSMQRELRNLPAPILVIRRNGEYRFLMPTEPGRYRLGGKLSERDLRWLSERDLRVLKRSDEPAAPATATTPSPNRSLPHSSQSPSPRADNRSDPRDTIARAVS